MSCGLGRTPTTAVFGDVHLVAMGHVDHDPNIVSDVPAGPDPDRHRQTGRPREQSDRGRLDTPAGLPLL